jgi:formylglycine-generating enzyme required for sulfatase activity
MTRSPRPAQSLAQRWLRPALLWLGLMAAAVAPALGQERGQAIAEPFKPATIRIRADFADNPAEHGFGLIVGERHGKLYAVTAAHVVGPDHDDNPSTPRLAPQNISISLVADPDEPVQARLLGSLPVLDLALLTLPAPDFDLPWRTTRTTWCHRFAYGEDVWYIGRRQRWTIPVDRDAGDITQHEPDPLGRIQIAMDAVEPGSSGAPLIGADGLLGILIASDGSNATAVAADNIRRFVTHRGAPWQLQRCDMSASSDQDNGISGSELKPLEVFRDRLEDGGEGPPMVVIPAGRFMMGSPGQEPGRFDEEGPQHQVALQSFAIGQTEVTFADYERFAEATGQPLPEDQGWGRGMRPVINVSWDHANAYADWLSAQTGANYRLPSEAEWEYAARAGTETPFWTGDCIHTDQANYDGNYDHDGCGAKTGVFRRQTVPAGTLPANAFGLHEIAGNVWEWVEDCWHDRYDGAPTDGSAWLEANQGECARRVVRGGGWFNDPWLLRSALRNRYFRDERSAVLGFRLARTL